MEWRFYGPLYVECTVSAACSLVNTMMLTRAGGWLVAAVSSVAAVTFLVSGVLQALATGGAIAIAGTSRAGGFSMGELCGSAMVVTFAASAVVSAALQWFCHPSLGAVFPAMEPAALSTTSDYFSWVSRAYFFTGIMLGLAAIARALGFSGAPMVSSLVANIGTTLGFGIVLSLGLGAAAYGVCCLVGQLLGAAAMAAFFMGCRYGLRGVRVSGRAMAAVAQCGFPGVVEAASFYFGRLVVQAAVVSAGTVALVANAAATTFISFCVIPSTAVSMGVITSVGNAAATASGPLPSRAAANCALRYLAKAGFGTGAVCCAVFLLGSPLVPLFGMDPSASGLTLRLVAVYCVACPLLYPVGYVGMAALKAMGRVAYTSAVVVVCTWAFRAALSVALVGLGWGMAGIWVGMFADWIVRCVFVVAGLRRAWGLEAR